MDADAADTVVLVEGASDAAALMALAARHDRDLAAERVAVVPNGGAQSIGRFLARFGPAGSNLRLAGLCDAGEERDFRRGLERAGLGTDLSRADLERLGFFVSFVRPRRRTGPRARRRARRSGRRGGGRTRSFRTLQKQPAQRDRPHDAQLRRFFGSGSGRKIRYARLLVEALNLDTCRGRSTACSPTSERIEQQRRELVPQPALDPLARARRAARPRSSGRCRARTAAPPSAPRALGAARDHHDLGVAIERPRVEVDGAEADDVVGDHDLGVDDGARELPDLDAGRRSGRRSGA